MLALAGITYYARHLRPHEWLARAGLSLILGGAIGNLVDRVTMGYVLDFVDVYWGDWHFWAFNVADASISVGAVLVFVDLLVRATDDMYPILFEIGDWPIYSYGCCWRWPICSGCSWRWCARDAAASTPPR